MKLNEIHIQLIDNLHSLCVDLNNVNEIHSQFSVDLQRFTIQAMHVILSLYKDALPIYGELLR